MLAPRFLLISSLIQSSIVYAGQEAKVLVMTILTNRFIFDVQGLRPGFSEFLATFAAHPSALLSLLAEVLVVLVLLLLCHCLINFYRDPFNLRRFPAPSCAGFTSLWSAYHSRKLRRSRAILQAHQRFGPIIRIQPKHISFADPRAVQDIYGHKSPIVKSTFYKTISGGDYESLVSTLDRDEHARKRRYISNIFAQRNVVSMEPLVIKKVQSLLSRLDRAAESNEIIDIRQYLNYFTFDVISAMAFGNDPDLLRKGEDKTMAETKDAKVYSVNPIRAFQDTTVHVASLGHWPELLRITKPFTKHWPNSKSGDDFEAMCVHQVRQRLQKPSIVSKQDLPYGDFVQHLLVDNKGQDRKLPFGELVQEAGVFLSAGSDTTASSMTNTLYLLLKHPHVLEKLRIELKSALGGTTAAAVEPDSQEAVVKLAQASPLKYLRACIDEGLRHLTPTSVGLQRMTPPEGAEVAGHWIKGGITVSVPTYTIHHDPELFPDPWVYKPERWLEGSEEERQNQKDFFIPFTLGRHSCIGRNIAYLEQYVMLSTLVNRYDFEFAEEGFQLLVLERINANPGPMPVRIRRRL